MTDFADQASEITERDLAIALLARSRAPQEEPDEDEIGRYCLSCGVMIPPQRVTAVNAVRCVDCQTLYEKHGKLHGGCA